MKDRLHPESMRTLRQLAKLHGVSRLIAALREIERQRAANPRDSQS